MRFLLVRMIDLMKRPESKLAGAAVLFAAAAAMLTSVAMTSCEGTSSSRIASRPDDAAEVRGERGEGEGPVAQPPPPTIGGRADFRLSQIVGEPEIRVRIAAGVDRVKLESAAATSGGLWIAGGDETAPRSAVKGAVSVRLAGGWWVATSPNGTEVTRLNAAAGMFVGGRNSGDEIAINGTSYPGRVRLVPRSETGDRLFDVIGHVKLEEYLPGVVAKEMPAGWPRSAYEVQAVCARTYAMHERIRSGTTRAAFDVESNERDQAYAGATKNKTAIEAVRATRGWVLADGDLLLRAYYSSTCGGRTASARETWPTGPGFEFNLAGPIQAKARESACQISPLHRWSVKRDRWELTQRLRAYGERSQMMVRKIKNLWSIEAAAYNADGRPCAFKIIEPGGTWYQLSGEQLRLAMNQSVTLSPAMGPPVPVEMAVGYAASDAETGVSAGPSDVTRANRVNSSDVEVSGPRGANNLTISGRGFGHGVGMCQYCARAFADRGEEWREMLARFYPGAGMVKAY